MMSRRYDITPDKPSIWNSKNESQQLRQGVSIGVQRAVALYTTLLEVKIEEALYIADFYQI